MGGQKIFGVVLHLLCKLNIELSSSKESQLVSSQSNSQWSVEVSNTNVSVSSLSVYPAPSNMVRS
jgi:hypothetical protein